MPINYQNGKIYKIINEDNEIIYIGSTAQELLCDRYKNHKLKAPNHKIILIQNYPCNSKQELCMKEQQIIEQYSNLLNKYKAFSSEEEKKEYYKYNKNERLEYQKQYIKQNKEIINEKAKQNYQQNKEIIIEKAKQNYQQNKNEILEKQKEYYKNNKNELSKKITCEYCNCELNKSSLKRHQKTQKCLKIQNELK